jgi:hypothetical protein
MGAFYGKMILNKKINRATGQRWTLEDVPAYWRPKVEEWLAGYGG